MKSLMMLILTEVCILARPLAKYSHDEINYYQLIDLESMYKRKSYPLNF